MRFRCSMCIFGAALAGACGQSAPKPAPAEAAVEAPAPDPFRFRPTIAPHLEGRAHALVLECGNGGADRVEFLVAEVVEGSLSLRQWTFDQRGKARLELAGEPQVLVRLEAGATDDAERLTALRRCVAAPGSLVTRPLGLAALDPRAAAAELHAAAMIAHAGHVSSAAGVEAVARVFRGCDDDLVFTPGRLALVVRELGEPAWEIEDVEREGDRRAEMKSSAGSLHTLTWLRKSEGWVVTGITEGSADEP